MQYRRGIGTVLQLSYCYCEGVGADPCQAVRFAQRFIEPCRSSAEQHIADMTPEGIVQLREAVQVDQDDCDDSFAVFGALQKLGKPILKQRAVGEPGECIVISKITEPFLFLYVLQAECNVSGQLVE